MKGDYISEFTLFMNHYLAIHPEVVEDQKRGWDMYWDRQVDLVALEKAKEDYVPDDGYGFHPAYWGVTHRPPRKESGESQGR
ncbi:MAG TPA: DUF3460 family protein [Sulfuriferula sp.]|nr:DUF3460 family protein [Sulfuriferula sp.]